jgi:hypothetical protein
VKIKTNKVKDWRKDIIGEEKVLLDIRADVNAQRVGHYTLRKNCC